MLIASIKSKLNGQGKGKCFLNCASKICRTQSLLLGNLHCIIVDVVSEGDNRKVYTINLDVTKIDLVGKLSPIKLESQWPARLNV